MAPAGEEPLPALPPRGRPLHFDEERSPIGAFQTPTVRAEPTELQAEEPLTYTIRITASGKVFRAPIRPDLGRNPEFTDRFEIEDLGAGDGRLDAKTWEFVYRLRPRGAEVTTIPGFPYAFFTPGFLPPQQGYQTRFVPAIELTVKPRAEVKPAVVTGGATLPRGPDALYELASDQEISQGYARESPPDLALLAILLVGPPLLCALWYAVWRRAHPHVDHLSRQRRSRAARTALNSLAWLQAGQTEQAASIVAAYLRERFELASREPTPFEVADHLRRAGTAPESVERAADFFRNCDTLRFAADAEPESDDPVLLAKALILALETPAESRAVGKGGTIAGLVLLSALSATMSVMAGSPYSRNEEARLNFEKGLKDAPDSPQASQRCFRESAQAWESFHGRGWDNPSTCRNAGNAWLLGGDTARAIRAYRHGLQLDPGDRALRECLAFAREQVVYPSSGNFARPPEEHRPPWLPRLSAHLHLVLLGAVYVIGWLMLTRWLMTRHPGLLIGSAIGFALFLMLGASLIWQDWQRQEEQRHPLVVIKDDGVLLYHGNGLAYPRYETPLNAGVEARLLFERGDWLQIELTSGEVGWVPREYALVGAPGG